MKVVLQKDVKDMGRAGDVVEQADGYALNYLIPKGLAVPVQSSLAKQTIQKQKEAATRKEVQHELLHEMIKALDGETIMFRKNVNEQGGLYDKIDTKEILAAIKEQKGKELPESVLSLEESFATQGEYDVTISDGEVDAKINISIGAAS